MAEKKPSAVELLAAELAKLKLCPGNEAHRYAKTIIELVRKFDTDDMDVAQQLADDDVDIEELLKNDKAIMGGIVSLSKLVTAMHDTFKRLESAITTKGATIVGSETETVTN